MKLDRDVLVAYRDALMARFPGTVVQQKEGSIEGFVGGLLLVDLLGVLSEEAWKRASSTFLDRVCLAFELGAGDLVSQASTLGHEFTHVEQWRTKGELFVKEFCLEECRRAEYEAEAWTTSGEIRVACGAFLPSPEQYAAKLVNYGCDEGAREHCRRILELRWPAVQAGAVQTTAGRVFREVLR
jgi:hypothetical protein